MHSVDETDARHRTHVIQDQGRCCVLGDSKNGANRWIFESRGRFRILAA
jgi:hypothetical protein